MLDDRLDLGRKAMPDWLDVFVAELLDEVGADEQCSGEEDLDDDEYCDYHCSCFLVVNIGSFRYRTDGLLFFHTAKIG